MENDEFMNRRGFLRLAGLGTTALLTGDLMAGASPGVPCLSGGGFYSGRSGVVSDLELALRAVETNVPLLSGETTRVWSYQGEVLRGDLASLQTIQAQSRRYPTRSASNLSFQAPPRPAPQPYTYLGPIIRARKGQRIRINFTNLLPEATVIHWHGLHVPPEMDAHPRYLVAPGQSYVYEFDVANRAGTYWFHPHPDGRTARQVYNGLAGLFIVSDEEENVAGLPSGSYDIPLIIQDRVIDANNQFVYQTGGMMDNLIGFLGDHILVNGRPDFTLTVFRRPYRLRLLNGSNSRVYKLAWNDGAPLTVIATDGGLLEASAQRSYVMLAPGERVELWADFSDRPTDSLIELRSLEFPGMGTMGGGQPLQNGAPFKVMNVRVIGRRQEKAPLPAKLSSISWHRLDDAINAATPRSFSASMGMMRWLLNGRSFEMNNVAENEIVRLNTTEVWELNNVLGSGMMGGMSMIHPLHIHGLQFQVIERQIASQQAAAWESVRNGYVDEGWKDTVMLMPGERVKLLLRFEDFTGLYVYHCHNLEHEDGGMMRNYLIRA